MAKMTEKEVTQFIEFYIGVDDYGQIRGFRDWEHLREFYYVDCDLDIDPPQEQSLTEEFENILRMQSPQNQARILRAGIQEFFVYSEFEYYTIQEKLKSRLEKVADRLESESTMIEIAVPSSTSETVRASIEEAANAIHRGRVSRAIDRMHTALHAHIKHLCDEENIEYPENPKIKKLFSRLRECHPALQFDTIRAHDVDNILNKLSAMIDALSPIRNKATLSHPPEEKLLDEVEATLAVNATSSIFNYLEHKIQSYSDSQKQRVYPASVDDIPF